MGAPSARRARAPGSKRDGRRDAREHVAATPIRNSTSARSTSENPGRSAIARPRVEQPDRGPDLPRSRAPMPRRSARTSSSAAPVAATAVRSSRVLRRLVEAARARQRLGAGERGLDPAALVGRDAVREEGRVDSEPRGQPLDRLSRRAGLPALDLADVLLREALTGQLGLGQPGRHSKLAHALTQASSGGIERGSGLGSPGVRGMAAPVSETHASDLGTRFLWAKSPKKVITKRKPSQATCLKIT